MLHITKTHSGIVCNSLIRLSGHPSRGTSSTSDGDEEINAVSMNRSGHSFGGVEELLLVEVVELESEEDFCFLRELE